MSTTTTNYQFVKPELTDVADITATNGNWDKIDTELPGKVSKNGDTMTAHLRFENTDAYHALTKLRTINGQNYLVNFGCGILGGDGVATLEVREGNETTSPLLGRLELGERGLSYVDRNNKRTYLTNNGVAIATIE